MGSVCSYYKQEKQEESVLPRRPKREVAFRIDDDYLCFKLTTESLTSSKFSADLLVIFLNQNDLTLAANPHFDNISRDSVKKLEKAIADQKRDNKDLTSWTFGNTIKELNFERIGIVICGKYTNSSRAQFKTRVKKYFTSLESLNIRSVAVLQFINSLQVPKDTGIGLLVNGIIEVEYNRPEDIYIRCFDNSKIDYYSDILQDIKNQKRRN